MVQTGSAGIRASHALTLSLVAAIAVAMLMALVPAEVEAAKHRHNVRAWLENTCVGGDAPRGSRLWVTWKNTKGAVKKKGHVKASAKGRWSLCTGAQRVAPGDRIMAKLGKRKRTAVVPRMDVTVDRETSVVSGRTKANQQLVVQVCWWREQFLSTHCEARSTRSDASGRFALDMDTVVSWGELLGGDKVEVFTIGSGRPHTYGRMQLVPYVKVTLGSDQLAGGYTPGGSLTVDLKDPSLAQKAGWSGIANRRARVWSNVYEGHVRISGLYSGAFSPAGPVVQVGDRVQSPALPPSYGLPVRDIEVSAVASTDVVTGSCASETRYQLRATTNGKTKTLPDRMTDASGSFTRDLTGKHDVRNGTVVRLTCWSNDGDRVSTGDTVK